MYAKLKCLSTKEVVSWWLEVSIETLNSNFVLFDTHQEDVHNAFLRIRSCVT